MFVPSTSDARVNKPPISFTNKARVDVINNLTNTLNNSTTLDATSTSSSPSIATTTTILTDSNELNKTKSRTSSLLPSFFTKSDKDKNNNNSNNNIVLDKELSPSPTHQTSTASSLRSSVYSSLLPSYHQLAASSSPPITKTMTNTSIESAGSLSIFSSISSLRSVKTSNSSIFDQQSSHDSGKFSLPSISNILKSNNNNNNNTTVINHQLQLIRRTNSTNSRATRGDEDDEVPRKTISLEKAISDIKDHNQVTHQNIGYEVFRQLNEAIAEILKIENLQLIDWNLNLIRCSLIVNELPPLWGEQIPEITVNGNRRYKIQDGFQSELVKLISSYRRQQKNYLPSSDLNFKKFIKNVMQNRFLIFEKKLNDKVTIKFNKNIKEEVIKIQVIPDVCSEDEFIQFLTDSDLFKEFKLEREFREKVATISIRQSKFLQSLKKVNTGKDELLYPYKILSLRNFFLNLLVASQTLFEFHYTINELLGKEKDDGSMVDVDDDGNKMLNDQEMKWLWDNIRERNFKKIEVFDRFY